MKCMVKMCYSIGSINMRIEYEKYDPVHVKRIDIMFPLQALMFCNVIIEIND